MKKIKTPSRNRKNCGALQFSTLLLLGYSLAGCALPVSAPPKVNAPSEVHSARSQTVRAIIYFQRPTTDSKHLSAAISDACHCLPVFFRSYDNDALIYEIALPQGQGFAAFEKTLMQNAAQLGIKAVEQDRIMHYQ